MRLCVRLGGFQGRACDADWAQFRLLPLFEHAHAARDMDVVLEDRVGLGSRANPGECQELSPGWLDWAGCLADDGPTGRPYRSATMRASRLDVRASQAMGRLLRAQKELLSLAAEQRRIGLEMKLAMNSLYGKLGAPRSAELTLGTLQQKGVQAAIMRLADRGEFYVDTDRVR